MSSAIDVIERPLKKEPRVSASIPDSRMDLKSAIASLKPVSLKEMADVKLMNRVDTKFMMPTNALPSFIKSLADQYFIQEIDGNRLAEYKTLYLDTEGLKFFLDHVNGKLNHIKWRIRSYVDSDLSFLEIKKKSNTGRTDKKRIPYNSSSECMDNQIVEFINRTSGLSGSCLKPTLTNNFNRITLVNHGKTERLTIDLNISFTNCKNGKSVSANNLAIVEIKQDKTSKSAAGGYFEFQRIKKIGISKYCLGLVLTSDYIKGNLYKQKLRNINKITSQK